MLKTVPLLLLFVKSEVVPPFVEGIEPTQQMKRKKKICKQYSLVME